MVNRASEFCKPENVMVQICVGTLASAKGCSQLPEHRKFVRCENDFVYSEDEILSLVELYAKQVLWPDFDIAESREAFTARKVFLRVMIALSLWRRADNWTVPPGIFLCRTSLRI